jgi:predicted phosphatase
MRVKRLVVFDFDGVLHEHPKWVKNFGSIDLTPVHLAFDNGYTVAIVTANDVRKVARSLRAIGIDAKSDRLMRRARWDGGRGGQVVLVTQRKLAGNVAFVDDRAIHWTYGSDAVALMVEINKRAGRTPS